MDSIDQHPKWKKCLCRKLVLIVFSILIHKCFQMKTNVAENMIIVQTGLEVSSRNGACSTGALTWSCIVNVMKGKEFKKRFLISWMENVRRSFSSLFFTTQTFCCLKFIFSLTCRTSFMNGFIFLRHDSFVLDAEGLRLIFSHDDFSLAQITKGLQGPYVYVVLCVGMSSNGWS